MGSKGYQDRIRKTHTILTYNNPLSGTLLRHSSYSSSSCKVSLARLCCLFITCFLPGFSFIRRRHCCHCRPTNTMYDAFQMIHMLNRSVLSQVVQHELTVNVHLSRVARMQTVSLVSPVFVWSANVEIVCIQYSILNA